MQYRSITLLSIIPLAIIVMVMAGLFAPKRSGNEIPLSSPFEKGGKRGILPLRDVRVGLASLSVEIANTPETRKQGLSGHAPLTDDQGMLFIFPAPSVQTFWMVDMTFPLDIIWIGTDRKVVGITANVPAPFPGAPVEKLPLYSSPFPVQYVLEVNAGWAKSHNVKIGDVVNW